MVELGQATDRSLQIDYNSGLLCRRVLIETECNVNQKQKKGKAYSALVLIETECNVNPRMDYIPLPAFSGFNRNRV